MLSASKSGQYQGYQISRSVRLRSSASAYFNRTPASAGNRKTWTWSGWFKLGTLSARRFLFSGGSGTTDTTTNSIEVRNNDTLTFQGGASQFLITTQVFRDPSAWYHIVCAFDTTQSTSSDRIKLYVNGVQITAFSTASYPTLNTDYGINQAQLHCVGSTSYAGSAGLYFDGYLTEINFIDGQALTPSSFGQYNAYGVWSPIKYNGTYGTNGFYLNFSDNSNNTAATIGKDYSGNGNNWTPNNISVTSGVTYDSMLDTPTPYADGGNGRGNYAVLNPLTKALSNGGSGTTSNGNLTIAYGATNWYGHKSSIAVTSGKWYYEVTNTTGTIYVQCGFTSTTSASETSSSTYRYRSNGEKVNSAYSSYGATWSTAGDVCGVAFDLDAGTITFYKNGVSQGTAFSSIPAGEYAAEVIVEGGTTANANFGQRPFSYTPPTGFVALNTQNLPSPTIMNGAQYMAATTYTGTGSALTVSNGANNTIGTTFQPDLVWIKSRSNVTNNNFTDSIRGVTKLLFSNSTAAEATFSGGLSSFNSNGFSLASGGDTGFSANGYTYVAWQWQAGRGTTSSNTNGSITSTVSVNQTAGFSVVTYTGTGANATVGHGLGVAPSMIILKQRNAVDFWVVWQSALANTEYLLLNSTNAKSTAATYWNSTSPTSSVFSLGTDSRPNGSGTTYVAYCWAAVAGFSKFGSYTGNGSTDGPFVYCGFRPRFVLYKCTSTTGSWYIWDTARNAYNAVNSGLFPDLSNAEITSSTYDNDFLSNGFKLRNPNANNASGATYIFAAFAENPFKYALAR